MSERIIPVVSGTFVFNGVHEIKATKSEQINPKTSTYFQLDSGFSQRSIDGMMPLDLNVNLNQLMYKQIKPDKPSMPLVNERAFHGPSGAKSNMV